MAKIVILQNLAEEWLGVMYISSMLKAHGHQCDIYVESLEEASIVRSALSDSPDIICFSCLMSDYNWALEKSAALKRHSNALIVFGGTHVTLNPNEVILNPNVDIICLGEGEYPMLELADAVDKDEDFSKIKNLWVKKKGKVVKNETRSLIEDLDSLPFPDRGLYAKYSFFQKRGKRPLHFGRGCPYSCSYCHNASKKALFNGKGKYVRWRSMESILKEVKEIKEKSFVKVLHFIDDSFGINREWLKEFIKKLSSLQGERIGLQANMRADMVTEDLCEIFNDYGVDCLRIRFAVECGDQNYRREILKKDISDDILIKAAKLFRKYKINFVTYNMIGLPGETIAQALATLRLNVKLRPLIAICFVYQPYPGTELADYALRNEYLSSEMLKKLGTSEFQGFFHSKSILRQKDVEKSENLHKIFSIVAKYPFLFPLATSMANLRMFSPLLQLIYKIYVRKLLFQRKLIDKY